MIPLKIKHGASLRGMRPEILFTVQVAQQIWQRKGAQVLVITAGTDGSHSRNSLHYVGLAIDFRTRNLPGGAAGQASREAAKALANHLGVEYDVVWHETHVHVEYQPEQQVT